MKKFQKTITRLSVALLALVTLFTGFGAQIGVLSADALVEHVAGSDSLVRTSLAEIKSILTSTMYNDYDALYSDVPNAASSIKLDLFDYDTELTTATVQDGTGTLGTACILVADDGNLTYSVDFASAARYCIRIEYYTGDVAVLDADGKAVSEGVSANIERMVLVDSKVPFKEARSIKFARTWIDALPVFDENGKSVKDENGVRVTYPSTGDEYKEFINDPNGNSPDASARPFLKDNTGNELKPDKQLLEKWVTFDVQDSTGYYNQPLRFYFPEGKHTVTLTAVSEPLAIRSIELVPAEEYPTYSEYLSQHSGVKKYDGDAVYVQAEYSTMTSDRTIYQTNDRSSAISQPQDPSRVVLNAIGGDKWQYVGQWIEWDIEVPETAMYSIVVREKQSYYSGMFVSRKITVNGQVPFKEAANLRFNYNDRWVTTRLNASVVGNDGETDYSHTTEFEFYLEKGVNHIRMYVVLGDMAELLSTVEESLNNINTYYRKILMITGPKADEYRDYGFDKLIPDVLKGLVAEAQTLTEVSDQLSDIIGETGDHAAILDRVAITLNRMGTYPSTIAGSMSTLKDYTGSLGSWLTDTQNQPLLLDYICLQSPAAALPPSEANFFEATINEIKKFFASFFSDYNSLGTINDDVAYTEEYLKTSVTVWTSSSREQAQIINNLVDNDFAAKYGLPVEVKLVVGGTLLPATLAGTGPDVSMSAAQGDPVNYAIRSAVKSLNTTTGNTEIGYNFNDLEQWRNHPVYSEILDSIDTFDETTQRFAGAAMTPLTLYGESYGIPENMSFSMMFYRKDLFVELGVEVPNTWDDFYDIIYTIQSNQLDIGFPTGVSGSNIWMYQQDEEIYDMGDHEKYLKLFRENYTDEELYEMGWIYKDKDGNVIPKTDGMTINYDSDIALGSFKDVCRLFTSYAFPVSYSFANRFRQGTMPLAITDYTNYNTLIVFAPEIQGMWEFTPLPGTASLNGNVNNTTVASVTAMMMMRGVNDDNALAAWTFMQWWTSADVQSAYGNEMIALLGPSAKQNTANMEALSKMSWTRDEYENLYAQFQAVKCTPEFPGSYIIGRYTNFAFLDVYNKHEEPVEELQSYIVDINNELTRKRKEFNLPTIDDIKQMEQNLAEAANK